MHRSNFGRTRAGSLHINKLIKTAESQVERRVDAKLEHELGMIASKISILDNRIATVLDRVDNLIATRLERGLGPVAAGTSVLNQKFDATLAKVSDLTSAKLATVRADVNALVSDVTKEIASVRAALASILKTIDYDGRFNSVDASLKDVTPSLKKLTTTVNALVKKKSIKGSDDVLASGLMDIMNRLEAVANVAEATPKQNTDLAELLALIRAPKKVIRDRDGNISGWEISGSIH